ncbi:MAG: serine/threonine-protein phosphatase [Bacteroidetes bacterium]|nr:serine/threonine-protein phosphatase [Fibrella sp.]
MEIRLAQPVGFSQPGSRPNNEDILFPEPDAATPYQSWFMVCDGVGGAERGEVASQLAVTQFDAYFRAHPAPVITAEYIQQALSAVQDRFDSYVRENPAAAGMGTTLTLVYLHEAGATVAHLGDSRVYLVRQGRIQWRTDDHSYVNELVKGGVLTADQARHHPQRNIITRAIQGGGNDRSVAAIQFISDLQPGDYFFLCSDGVLERVSDELLENVLGSHDTNAEKMRIIQACCTDQTRDNFTAYLIQVQTVTGKTVPGFADSRPVYERPVSTAADEVTVVAMPYHAGTDEARPAEVMAIHDSLSATLPKPTVNQPTPVAAAPLARPAPAAKPTPAAAKSSSGNLMLWSALVVVLAVAGFIGWNAMERANQPVVPAGSRLQPQVSDNERIARTPVAASTPDPTSVSPVPDTATLAATADTTLARRSSALGQANVRMTDERPGIEREVEAGLYIGQLAGKRGLLAADQKTWLVEPLFDQIGTFQNGLAKVSRTGETKYLSRKGKLYDEISPLQCDRIRVRLADKYGYLNQNGELAIGIRYAKANLFGDDCTAKVYIDAQLFQIDRNGLDVKTGRGPQVLTSQRTPK